MIRVQFEQGQSEFSRKLRERVQVFQKSRAHDGPRMLAPATLIVLLIMILFLLLLQKDSFLLTGFKLTALGFLLFLGGTYVLHEGTHGNLSRNPKVNRLFVSLFELIACFSADQYRLRHLTVHHSYPNVGQLDYDLDTNGLIRLSPEFPRRSIHRFQFLYAPFLYCIGIIHIAWVEDIKRLFTSKLGVHSHSPWTRRDIFRQLGFKFLHAAIFLALPMTIHSPGNVLLAYLYVYVLGSLGIALVFQVTHVNPQVDFTPLNSRENSFVIKKDWFEHQIATSINYAPESRLALYLTGGVNLQIEHHLFPTVSLVDLPELRKIVKGTAEEFGIKYSECPTFFQAIWQHLSFLKKMGRNS